MSDRTPPQTVPAHLRRGYVLLRPPQAGTSRDAALRNLIQHLPSAWTTAAGLGLLFYGAVRLDLALFYAPFHVTPEEVGLSYAEVLQIAAFSLVAFACFVLAGTALFLFLVAAMAIPAAFGELLLSRLHWLAQAVVQRRNRTPWSHFRRTPHRIRRFYLGLGFLLCLAVTYATTRLPGQQQLPDPLTGGEVLATALVVGPLLYYLLRRPVSDRILGAASRPTGTLARRLIRLCVTLNVVVLLLMLPIAAHNVGKELSHGEFDEVLPSWINQAIGTPFRAELVEVVAVSNPLQGLPVNGCALYLGERNSIFVLAQQQRTFRVYAGSVTVRHVGSGSTCVSKAETLQPVAQ